MTDLPAAALAFALRAHGAQIRKFTREPYVNHCRAVAATVAEYASDPEVIAAALLHDTVEDTATTADDIRAAFGDRVASLVLELTDVSRPEDGNRKARKELDRRHLARSSPEGATVKLADIIDNVPSVVEHDKDFARVYLAEMRRLLQVLKHGNADLWRRPRRSRRANGNWRPGADQRNGCQVLVGSWAEPGLTPSARPRTRRRRSRRPCWRRVR
jgi:(p)ppGpp synthase/HD superfamily hydrolase